MDAALNPLQGAVLLATGAAGFLCSYYLDVAAAFNRRHPRAPCRVIALDNHKTGRVGRVEHLQGDPNFRFVQHDVTQPFVPGERVDFCIHGAGIASPMTYRQFPLETIDVNVQGLRHLLELARQQPIQGMLYMSTSEIYGDPPPERIPTPEDYRGYVSCTGPRACYDESKRLGETLCVVYSQKFGVPVKIIRPFNVYGPGQPLDDQRILPDLMSAAVSGRPIALYSDGRASRSFCYVRDFIMGTLWVLFRGDSGAAYNVGNDEEITIGQLAETVAELAANAGTPLPPIEHRNSPDAHYLTDNPQRRCPDIAKLRGLAPTWSPEIKVRAGLARTLRACREDAGLGNV
jgi:dTDP-glucose 4,6-dehydratase/UDP-glucuronate decarboxylase